MGTVAGDALLLRIARCPLVADSLASPVPLDCSPVVHAQGRQAGLQVPEPWNGEIETAPILFVTWNPSFNPREHPFPTADSNDADIVEFFSKRFEHSAESSQTWRELRGIASRLLGRRARPGIDYASTDVVHCKSARGIGASRALGECTRRYLEPTLAVAGARVVVGLGTDAWITLAARWGVPAVLGAHRSQVPGEQRLLVLLGAPGSATTRTLDGAGQQMAAEALARER
jgi:hypothetical protein